MQVNGYLKNTFTGQKKPLRGLNRETIALCKKLPEEDPVE